MYVEELHLQVTRNCTLECEHCLRGDREIVNMSPQILDEIFKDIKNIGRLLLTGGEPLLAIQTLEYLVELLKTNQVRVNKIILITNGTVLSDRVLKVLYDLQECSYLVLRLSADIFHNLELEKRKMFELREKNLNILGQDKFYNFSQYLSDSVNNRLLLLVNKGRASHLSKERLDEINKLVQSNYIVNKNDAGYYPITRIVGNRVEGNITINVYGYVVSYGQSYEEEDKEAYDIGLNVMEMSCEEAIRIFVDRYEIKRDEFSKKLNID